MKNSALVVAIAILVAGGAQAADEATTNAVRAQMQKLVPLMEGKWKGSGWVKGPDGERHFTSEETIERRMDGAALVIEGVHREARSGLIQHHAVGTIAWDATTNDYRMLSALSDGRTGAFPMKLREDGRLVWTIAPQRGPTMRYTITLEPPGTWREEGEMSRDAGVTWVKFFDMSLKRVP